MAGYSTSSGGSGNADALIAKYNSVGTLQWQRSIGGSGNEYASQMALSPDGSLLVLSGNTSTSTASIDALITVLNTATPSVSWQRSIGSTGYDYGYGVAVDGSNNIYWLAGINGTLSLLKISSGAVIQWQKSLPSSFGSGSVNLGPDGSLRVFAPIFAGADIYQFSVDGTLLLSRSSHQSRHEQWRELIQPDRSGGQHYGHGVLDLHDDGLLALRLHGSVRRHLQ